MPEETTTEQRTGERTGTRRLPRPNGAVAMGRKPRFADPDPQDVRVPRLLVAGSEMSWRFLVCVAALAVVVYAVSKVSFAFVPVFIALMLATLLVPPARALQRRGLPPALATTIVFLAALLAFSGIIALLAPPVVNQFGELGDQVRGGVDKLAVYAADLPLGLDEQEAQKEIDKVEQRLTENSSSITNGVLSGAQMLGQFIAGLAIMLVVLFFFVKDGPRLWRWAVRLFPEPRRAAADEMGERSWEALTQYVRGVVFVAVFDAIGIGLALGLIGVPLAFPLAVLTFFAAFIPIIGAWVAGATAMLVALVSGGPVDALLVALSVAAVQQLEGSVLYPMIIGRTMSLHPLVILLAVTIGGILAGIVGAAIAVPIAAMAGAAVVTLRRHTPGGEVTVESS